MATKTIKTLNATNAQILNAIRTDASRTSSAFLLRRRVTLPRR